MIKPALITITTPSGKRKIGPGQPTFIVAEISANHQQNYSQAIELIDAAIHAGADAIKLQTYTPDTHTIDSNKKWFKLNKSTLWPGRTLYDLYQTTYTPWKWQPRLKKYVETKGKVLFSAPSDEASVNLLQKMRVPLFKVTSFELTDLELLTLIGKTKKPVIISRGLANLEEIRLALKTLRLAGAREIAVLHCVSAYPAEPKQMNLKTIPDLIRRFNVVTGLSDHTLGTTVPIAAVALGATIVEKHLTLKRASGGPDATFSLEPAEFKKLVQEIRIVEQSLGRPTYQIDSREAAHRVFRRSIFVVENIKKGEPLTRQNIRTIRPGYGLSPKFLPKVLGRKVKKNIERGTPLSFAFIK